MKIETQRFITLSNLFEGLDDLLEEWRDQDHEDFTFGDCQMSLITRATFRGDLANTVEYEDDEDDFDDPDFPEEEEIRADQLATLHKRLDDLPDDVYIDLEN